MKIMRFTVALMMKMNFYKAYVHKSSSKATGMYRKNSKHHIFSATLLPVNYYKMLLTGNLNDYAMYVNSPFSRENRVIAVGGDVTSKYTKRGRNEYEKISQYICEVISKKQGNYMVFFLPTKCLERYMRFLWKLPLIFKH